MKHIALTPFGAQPVTAAQLSSLDALRAAEPAPLPIDKWVVFNDLRVARKVVGVSDRDLTVLHALLSFLPVRELSGEALLTVFPSNRTLSERAHGMAESTLRRHLAALVAAGVIRRNDSPNGKRFARRDSCGGFGQTYGFDLSPLLTRGAEFADLARHIETEAAERHLARERVVLLLRDASKLLAYHQASTQSTAIADHDAGLSVVRSALRRSLDLPTLQRLEGVLRDILCSIYPDTTDASGTAAQYERHHSDSNKDLKESEQVIPAEVIPSQPTKLAVDNAVTLPLPLVLSACPDFLDYASEAPRTWREFASASERLRPMMGISDALWHEATAVMGRENAGITLAAILQRLKEIANPGAYLRSLTRRAEAGLFTPVRMVLSLLNRPDAAVL